jgi:hypothetical protein
LFLALKAKRNIVQILRERERESLEFVGRPSSAEHNPLKAHAKQDEKTTQILTNKKTDISL